MGTVVVSMSYECILAAITAAFNQSTLFAVFIFGETTMRRAHAVLLFDILQFQLGF